MAETAGLVGSRYVGICGGDIRRRLHLAYWYRYITLNVFSIQVTFIKDM